MTVLTCGCEPKANILCPQGLGLWQAAQYARTRFEGSQRCRKTYELAKRAYEAHVTAVVESSP